MIFGIDESGEGAGGSKCQLFTERLTITLYPPLFPSRLRKQPALWFLGRAGEWDTVQFTRKVPRPELGGPFELGITPRVPAHVGRRLVCMRLGVHACGGVPAGVWCRASLRTGRRP